MQIRATSVIVASNLPTGLSRFRGPTPRHSGLRFCLDQIKPQRVSVKTLPLSVLAVFSSLAGLSSALAQDAAVGENSFKKCLVCHSIGEGAKNKIGPVLNGLDGRKSGSVQVSADANKNSGITWNKDQFLYYIKDPKAKIPGTKMVFTGIKDETEANDLWAYISQFDKDGKKK